MRKALSTVLLLAVFSYSSLFACGFHLNEKESALKMTDNFGEENDLALDDREAREELRDFNGNLDFDGEDQQQNDDDLYFLKDDDSEMEKRKR